MAAPDRSMDPIPILDVLPKASDAMNSYEVAKEVLKDVWTKGDPGNPEEVAAQVKSTQILLDKWMMPTLEGMKLITTVGIFAAFFIGIILGRWGGG